MNVLLIDDHFCARDGLALLLKQILPNLHILQAENIDQGLAVVRNIPLNLILLDIQLPDKDGLTGLKVIRAEFPNLSVCMFSGVDDSDLVFESLRLGAMAFISKSLPRQEFVDSLRKVMSGAVVLPTSVVGQPATSAMLMDRLQTDPASLGLTPREFEILSWLVQGKCNKEIARKLNIEEQTVRNHLRPVFQKFAVATRTELLVKVFKMGIVFGEPSVGN
jgi:two-component system, NarL family, nitrate/nitrite response regulator NarL